MLWITLSLGFAAPSDWFCLSQEPPPAIGEARTLDEGQPVGLVPAGHQPGRLPAWDADYVDLSGTRWTFDAVLATLEKQGQAEAVAELRALQERLVQVQSSARWARKGPLAQATEGRRLRDERASLLADALCAINQGAVAPRPPVVWASELDPRAVADAALDGLGLAAGQGALGLPDATESTHVQTTVRGLTVEIHATPGAVDASVGWRVATGAFDDGPDHWGLAHLAEHLIFRHPGSMAQATAIGARGNAETHPGHVSIYTTAPAPHLDALLELDIARLSDQSFSDADLALEHAIVEREEDFRGDLVGTGHLVENDRLYALAFRSPPPDPVPRGDAGDVRAWMRHHLQPGSLTLVVASRFEPEAVRDLVEQTLASTAADWAAREPEARASWPDGQSSVVLPRGGSKGSRVAVAWRQPVGACDGCPDPAVVALGRLWLSVFGEERLAEILSQNHRSAQIAAAAGRRVEIALYARRLQAHSWVLGTEYILQIDVGSGQPDAAASHLAELPELVKELDVQTIVRPEDLEALRRWHHWNRNHAARDPESLVRMRLTRGPQAVAPGALEDVTADQVQIWLRDLLHSPPSRSGRYE